MGHAPLAKMSDPSKRTWRSCWSIDLEAATATHRDGWVFKFAPADDEPGAFEGKCIAQPTPLTEEHTAHAARIAREAGDAYIAAKNAKRGGKRGARQR